MPAASPPARYTRSAGYVAGLTYGISEDRQARIFQGMIGGVRHSLKIQSPVWNVGKTLTFIFYTMILLSSGISGLDNGSQEALVVACFIDLFKDSLSAAGSIISYLTASPAILGLHGVPARFQIGGHRTWQYRWSGREPADGKHFSGCRCKWTIGNRGVQCIVPYSYMSVLDSHECCSDTSTCTCLNH